MIERRAFARAFRLPISSFRSGAGPYGGEDADVDAVGALLKDVEVAYASQQPGSR